MPGLDSGIKLDKDVIDKFGKFKVLSTCPYDYLVLEIRQDDPDAKATKSKQPPESVYVKKIQDKGKSVEEEGGEEVDGVDASFASVTKFIKENPTEPVYVVMYIKVTIPGQTDNEKLVLVAWIPDDAPMKRKMKYSSTKEAVGKKIPELATTIVCNDWDDIRYTNIKKAANPKSQ